MAHVLVVDDEAHIGDLVSLHLSFEGHTTDRFLDGLAALEASRTRSYDLFIVDVEMPGISGFEFIARTRRDPSLKDTPAIIVSSLGSDEAKRQGREAGAVAYVVKSDFSQDEFLSSIRRLVDVERVEHA